MKPVDLQPPGFHRFTHVINVTVGKRERERANT